MWSQLARNTAYMHPTYKHERVRLFVHFTRYTIGKKFNPRKILLGLLTMHVYYPHYTQSLWIHLYHAPPHHTHPHMTLSSHYTHPHQRSPVGVEVANPELWYELSESHSQKVQVKEELELFIQYLLVRTHTHTASITEYSNTAKVCLVKKNCS